MSISSLMQVCYDVTRPSQTDDGVGGTVVVLRKHLETFGRIWPLGASERTIGSREESNITHGMVVASGLDIQRGDTVIEQGTTAPVYKVEARREPSVVGHHLRLDLQERQRGR